MDEPIEVAASNTVRVTWLGEWITRNAPRYVISTPEQD